MIDDRLGYAPRLRGWDRLPPVLGALTLCAVAAILLAGDGPTPPADDPNRSERPAELLAQTSGAGGAAVKPPAADLGWIGLMLEDTKDGIRVVDVFPAGPAAFAGVRSGDVLLKVGETSPESVTKAVEAIERFDPHKPATISVRRAGRPVELTVNTGSLAAFHQRYVREMLRRDPRDPGFPQRHGVSDADMQAELVRRLFEQNERLEKTLHDVLTEVQALRAEVRGRK